MSHPMITNLIFITFVPPYRQQCHGDAIILTMKMFFTSLLVLFAFVYYDELFTNMTVTRIWQARF